MAPHKSTRSTYEMYPSRNTLKWTESGWRDWDCGGRCLQTVLSALIHIETDRFNLVYRHWPSFDPTTVHRSILWFPRIIQGLHEWGLRVETLGDPPQDATTPTLTCKLESFSPPRLRIFYWTGGLCTPSEVQTQSFIPKSKVDVTLKRIMSSICHGMRDVI